MSLSVSSLYVGECWNYVNGTVCFNGTTSQVILTGAKINYSDILNPVSAGSASSYSILSDAQYNLTNKAGLVNSHTLACQNITGSVSNLCTITSGGVGTDYSIILDAKFNLTNKLGLQNSTLLACQNITGSASNLCTLTDTNSGGDLTEIIGGLGINVTSGTGAVPTILINKTYLDTIYYLASNPNGYISSYVDTNDTTAVNLLIARVNSINGTVIVQTARIDSLNATLLGINTSANIVGLGFMTSVNINTIAVNLQTNITNTNARIDTINSTLITQIARIDNVNSTVVTHTTQISNLITGNTTAQDRITNLNSTKLNVADAITTYVNRSLWTTHDNYPTDCLGTQAVRGLGDSLTCFTLTNSLQLNFLNITGTFDNSQVGLKSINNQSLNTTNTGTAGQYLTLGTNSQFTWTTLAGGGDLTDVFGGYGINVTNPNGPSPTIEINRTITDSLYYSTNNPSAYITDGNTNWDNSYGFITSYIQWGRNDTDIINQSNNLAFNWTTLLAKLLSAGGFDGANITSGTVADARIASTITRDSEVPSLETDAAHDTCAEITGCVTGAITYDSTAGWTNTTTYAQTLLNVNITQNVRVGNLTITNLTAASCDVKSDTAGVLYCGTDANSGGSGDGTGGWFNSTTSSTQTDDEVTINNTLNVRNNLYIDNGTFQVDTITGLIYVNNESSISGVGGINYFNPLVLEFSAETATSAFDPYIGSAISSGTYAKDVWNASHPGILRFSTATATNTGYSVATNSQTFTLAGGEKFTGIFRYTNHTNGINSSKIRIGFVDNAAAAESVDGVMLNITSNVANCLSANNSVYSTSTNSFSILSNITYTVTVEIINRTFAQCRLYNYPYKARSLAWEGNVTTNIPTFNDNARPTGSGFVAWRTGATSVATSLIYMDYMKTEILRELVR